MGTPFLFRTGRVGDDMANNRGFRWVYLWWLFGFCFLFSTVADASVRRYPTLIGANKATGGQAARNGNSLVTSNPLEGEWISRHGRKMHIPVEQGSYWSIRGTIINAQGMFRRNLPAVVIGGVITGLAYGLDWIFDEADQQWKKMGEGEELEPDDLNLFCRTDAGYTDVCAPSAASFCALFPSSTASGWRFSGDNIDCLYSGNKVWYSGRRMTDCPADSRYDQQRGACIVDGEYVPLTEADLQNLDPLINGANPDFIQRILQDACNGSNAPTSCFESLMEKTQLNGPSAVSHPPMTTTTTVTGPDGVTGTSTTVTTTTHNITYGPNYYDYSTTTNRQVTAPDGTTTTETETDAPPAGTPPPDPDIEPPREDTQVAQPCTGENCAGPAYADLYTPTEDTKESVLSEYMARAAEVPIFEAVRGFFDVSASGSCPIWTTQVEFDVWGIGFSHTLLFDYHCQPWFVDYRPFAMAVFLIFAAYVAFRIAVL